MAEKSTFIKMDRNICRWRWFHDPKTLQVFIWLLSNANVSPHEFESVTIQRGDVATSYQTICDATGLSIRSVRTALGHLKSTGEVTAKKYPKYQVISIVNYSLYQDKPTGKTTGNRQADDIQTTGNRQQYKNVKNIKNEKNIGGASASGLEPERPPAEATDYERWRNQ